MTPIQDTLKDLDEMEAKATAGPWRWLTAQSSKVFDAKNWVVRK